MKYSIIKAEKAELAKMDTLTLGKTIDRFVGNAKERIRKWELESKRAEDPKARKHALMRMDEASKRLEDYLEEQRELFDSRGLNKDRAFGEAIVPTGERTAGGVEILRIVKREESLKPFYDDDQVSAEDRKAGEWSPSWESDDDWDAEDGIGGEG